MLPLGGLHVKHAMQRGIWVPTQHLLWDEGKTTENLYWGGRSQDLPDANWLLAISPALNTRAPTLVPIWAIFFFPLKIFTSCFYTPSNEDMYWSLDLSLSQHIHYSCSIIPHQTSEHFILSHHIHLISLSLLQYPSGGPESESVTLRLTVSQYVLASSPLCGRLTRYCFLFKSLRLEFVVLSLWDALSGERPSQRLYGWQSVSSISWCRAHFVDVWPDIASSFQVFGSGICCLVSVGRPLWREAGSVLCKSQSSHLSVCIFTIYIFIFHTFPYTHTHTHTHIYIYIYIYTIQYIL
jgi:hypothetical protein